MAKTYPGMTVEALRLEKGISKQLFDGLFAAGGITLSQVCSLTGLEPYLVQNWVKRGFVTSPVKRVYSRRQFARIVIINMLRDTLQIERICGLIRILSGPTDSLCDDLIGDEELYHKYVDMIACAGLSKIDAQAVLECAEKAAQDYEETVKGDRKKLIRILCAMYYAHASARLRDQANETLMLLEES